MGKYSMEGGSIGSKGSHPDYEKNLRYAEALAKHEDTGQHLLNGLRVKVCNGEHIPKALLMISWNPANGYKRGNYATPVSLHQFNGDFQKTSTSVVNFYKKAIEESGVASEFINPSLKA
jgi:hypothetical protein